LIPDLRWAYIISGNFSWFNSFAERMSGPDVSIIIDYEDDKPPAYAWSSPHLSELDDPQEVADRAAAIKAIFDGALYIQYGDDYRSINLQELVHLPDENRVRRLVGNVLASPFSRKYQEWSYARQPRNCPFNCFASAMLFLSRHDENSRGMLQFLGSNGVTWISLYALLDFIKQGGWNDAKIATESKSSQSEIKRFTQTANNFSAIGPLARHGEKGWKPPEIIMTLSEAEGIILPAAKSFLLDKCTQLRLKPRWEAEEI